MKDYVFLDERKSQGSHTGQREQAHEHLTTATTMYREMGMTYWLEKAKAEQKT